MTDYTLLIIIVGAIAGLLRTLTMRKGAIVWPVVNIRKHILKVGLLASLILGAFASYLMYYGVAYLFPEEMPTSGITAAIVGIAGGVISLQIVNGILGRKIIETAVTPILKPAKTTSVMTINPIMQSMIETILREVPEIERVSIINGQSPGMLKAIIVPRTTGDNERLMKRTEMVLNRIIFPGIQTAISFPEEVPIDITLLVEILDGQEADKNKAEFTARIKKSIIDYINSLQPGESIVQSKIITNIVSMSELVRDVRGDKITSTPPFEKGRIQMSPYKVARAKDIIVQVEIHSIGEA